MARMCTQKMKMTLDATNHVQFDKYLCWFKFIFYQSFFDFVYLFCFSFYIFKIVSQNIVIIKIKFIFCYIQRKKIIQLK